MIVFPGDYVVVDSALDPIDIFSWVQVYDTEGDNLKLANGLTVPADDEYVFAHTSSDEFHRTFLYF